LIVSTGTWNKLSDEAKEMINKAAHDSEIYEAKLWEEQVTESRAEALKVGAEFIQVDKGPFREALTPLYEDFRKDPNKASWLNRIEAAGK
jgi:TRAP-type C4-dicarboxylate transport system substrate-binding protein